MSYERCPDCGEHVYPDTAGIPLSACHTCGIVALPHDRSDVEIIEDFLSRVCERAKLEAYYNSIAGQRIVDYGAAARAILAEMRRASE